jgi:flagellar hook-basal body complex protein FliE
MAIGITPIPSTTSIAPTSLSSSGASSSPAGFGESLARMIASAEDTSRSANTAVAHMVDGSGDVHEAMIALQRAELSLQLTVQVRNKLLQAYQDIMRMPI